ncbi:MAG TPA: DUF3037 domain-containing protein [Flavipsychrobacter sp.]|nr:DUF3037 domain-containing protein [Flavipsychrobacter sp.]
MHKLLYEYAVVRIVPRVEREEFINAGVVLFCKELKVLKCRTHIPIPKLQCLDSQLNLETLSENLNAFERIALGKNCPSKIARLDEPSRFRWLTATRSTIVQCSKVHPGFAYSLDDVFEGLFQKLVL